MEPQEATPASSEQRHGYGMGVLLLILIFAAVLRVPTLAEPWGGDQGVYGYIADGMLRGRVPYKDMYTNTGYGLYFAYALFFKLFGNHMIALHIGDLLGSLATVVVVYVLGRMLHGKECGVLAAGLAALFGSGQAFSGLYEMKGAWGTYWQLAQRETFMTPLIAGGILLAILADRRRMWPLFFCVGALVGLAATFKITAVAMLAILVSYVVLNEFLGREGGAAKLALYKATSIVLGAVVVQLPFLYYFWAHDALHEMYRAVFVHTSLYAKLSRGHIVANAFQGNTYILSENLSLWLFTAVSALYLIMRERGRENCLVAGWAAGTLLMIWGQGKFFGYHFLLIVAPFSVLAGFGVKRFLKVGPSWKRSLVAARTDITQMFLWVVLLGNLAAFSVDHYDYYRWNALYLSGRISKDKYYDVFNEYPLHLYSFRADREVASYLEAHAQPGAGLLTVNGGGDTVVHYLSGLGSPTRFTSTWYLFHKSLYDHPLTGELRTEFIEKMDQERPEYILLVYYTLDELEQEYGGDRYPDVTRLIHYVQDKYVLEKPFRDGRTLYKRI